MVIELKKTRVFDILYTGGDFCLNLLGDLLFTTCTNVVKVLNVDDGSERFCIGDKEQDPRISSFVLSEDNSEIVIAYSNDVIKRYTIETNAGITSATFKRQFRGTHKAPILVLKHFLKEEKAILATGSADFSVKIWDMNAQFCTHNFPGKSLVSSLCFVENGRKILVGYNEGQVRMFDLTSKARNQRLTVEWTNHTSRIVSIFACPLRKSNFLNGIAVFSRDQRATILDLKTFEKVKEVQLSETIENALYLGGDDQEFLTVGEQGLLKVWSLKSQKVLRKKAVSKTQLDNLVYCKRTDTVLCASAECDLMFVNLKQMKIAKQMAGYNDELFAACLVSEKTNCLAVANNSTNLIIYNLASSSCHLIPAHEQSIMTVDSPVWDDYLLASGSKDNSIVLWRIPEDVEQFSSTEAFAQKVALGTGHTHSVTNLMFSHSKSHSFIVTVSNDSTLKIWPLDQLAKKSSEVQKLTAASTIVAHNNSEINTVDVSLNDKLCVTASMDKTAKLWHIDRKTYEFCIAGTLSGHKRGVWAAKFSKNLQNVATCSGEGTIKIFSLLDNSCLQTLSGHTFAVFSIVFANKSTQLISADGGGFLKIWDLEKGICDKTIEAHSAKIWWLADIGTTTATKKDEDGKKIRIEEINERYASVGSEGQLVIWEDISRFVEAEQAKAAAKKLAEQQSLSNYMEQENFVEALVLTLDLAKPFQCHKVVRKLLDHDNPDELASVLSRLEPAQLGILLGYAAEWNTNTRTYATGQSLLNHVLRNISPQILLNLSNIDTIVQSFLPYANRHYERIWNLRTNISHLDYTFSQMRLN